MLDYFITADTASLDDETRDLRSDSLSLDLQKKHQPHLPHVMSPSLF